MAGRGSLIRDGDRLVSELSMPVTEPSNRDLPAPPSPPPSPVPPVALPLGVAMLTLVLTYWCVDIVSPALPDIQRSLALSGTGAGLVFALFFAGRLVTNLPAAFLVDRVGPRWTATLGAGLLLAGSALAALAPGESTLLPARGLQGTGVALLATAGLLSVLRGLPAGGAAMTAFNVATGVGGSAGLLSGGWLTDTISWRAVFWLSAGLGLALLTGSVLARTRAAALRAGDRPSDAPDLPPPVRPRGALAGALAANLLVYGNYSIWVVSLSLYVTSSFGADAAAIGTLLLVINAVHLLAAVPAGRFIRRFGAMRALAASFAMTALGLALVRVAPDQGWLLAPMALYAVGQVAGNSAAGDLLLRLGGHGGRAVGLVRLTSDVGLVAGPAAVGLLADTAGVGAPFVALAALSAAAAIAAWRSRPPTVRIASPMPD